MGPSQWFFRLITLKRLKIMKLLRLLDLFSSGTYLITMVGRYEELIVYAILLLIKRGYVTTTKNTCLILLSHLILYNTARDKTEQTANTFMILFRSIYMLQIPI